LTSNPDKTLKPGGGRDEGEEEEDEEKEEGGGGGREGVRGRVGGEWRKVVFEAREWKLEHSFCPSSAR